MDARESRTNVHQVASTQPEDGGVPIVPERPVPGLEVAVRNRSARNRGKVRDKRPLVDEIQAEAARGISVAWAKMPFQLGAWGTSRPATLLTADENIFFAGEHLSILQGWQEGAILSAYHAIDLIVARETA